MHLFLELLQGHPSYVAVAFLAVRRSKGSASCIVWSSAVSQLVVTSSGHQASAREKRRQSTHSGLSGEVHEDIAA